MVPATVDFAILVEVDEIYQQLFTSAADKAVRVPALSMTGPRGKNHNVSTVNLTTTLDKEENGRKRRCEKGGGKIRRERYLQYKLRNKTQTAKSQKYVIFAR